ncbi:MAG: Sorting nexin mvp1 [Cirrosporium novae-zelandiae]|nr:MAG: Sorting nexin mvp1 [Cirrosporium novae-zelandiae]
MSLFGTSPSDTAFASPSQTKSLFGDDPTPGASSNASLFADEADGFSPWSLPTPKKAARSDLIKRLLPATDVPDLYIDAYDAILKSGNKTGAGVSLTGLRKVLGDSGLDLRDQTTILNIIAPDGQQLSNGFSRSEFNVFLALIGLAQEGEDVTLDGVDERRRKLPEPSIPFLKQQKQVEDPESPSEDSEPGQQVQTPQKEQILKPPPTPPRNMIRDTLDDPWASPEMHQSHNHPTDDNASYANGASTNGITSSIGRFPRTTSAFTTNAFTSVSGAQGSDYMNDPNANKPAVSNGDGWGSYGQGPNDSFPNPDQNTLRGGFGGSGGDDQDNPNRNPIGRSIGSGRVAPIGPEEVINVTLIPEKEGIFMFQHRNYEVKSVRRGTSVVRRYSDFVWLLDCLHKRYPFRQLPLLPPKRLAVNGRHLSADAGFIEKRRRGLARFMNALVRHPILGQEQLVIMFLTVQTELAVWKKQATYSVQEEFTGKPLPPGLEDSLPQNLQETFDIARAGIKKSAEIYINVCTFLERLAKRNEGVAADSGRLSLALQSLTECTETTYSIDTNDVPLLNEGIKSTAKHLSTSQSLLVDESRAWDEGVLEDFKTQRDTLVSMRELFDRRDRLARDNIPQLERRIENNEHKLVGLRERPQETVKPGEIQKVEEAIVKDKQSIVDQHARGVFILECVRDELIFFQSSQYRISRLHQDWSQERVKYAELQAENWRSLSEELDGMPIGD